MTTKTWTPPAMPLTPDLAPAEWERRHLEIWDRHRRAFFAGGPTSAREAIDYLRDEVSLDGNGTMMWTALNLVEEALVAAERLVAARERLNAAQDAEPPEANEWSAQAHQALLDHIEAEEGLVDAVRGGRAPQAVP